ncbi:MAG: hypothetical protein V1841_02250 [Patescibacteria group bacterium]
MSHPADKLRKKLKIIYLAYAKENFCWRQHLSSLVLDKGYLPLNPYMNFDYFLQDKIDRNKVRLANNNLVMLADELWVIGQISDGVATEIRLAKDFKKPIKYFSTEGLPKKLKQ